MTSLEMRQKAKTIIENEQYYIFKPFKMGLYDMQLLLNYELYMDKKKAENESPPAIVPYCIEEFLSQQK
jgi:hypothetical protein